MGVVTDFGITLSTVGSLDIEIIDDVGTLHKLFLTEFPHCTSSPEGCIAHVLTET